MCFLDCHQPCLKIPSSPPNRPAFQRNSKCFLNNLISHHEKLLLFFPIFFSFLFFFFLFSPSPLLFVKTSLLLKTSFPRKSFLPKKILLPSFFKKLYALLKLSLFFPCIEKHNLFSGNSFLFFYSPKTH